jgi:hypothetical protein
VQRTAAAPSSLTLPIADPGALDAPGVMPPCAGRRRFAITIRVPPRAGSIVSTRVTYLGRRAKTIATGRRVRRTVIDLRNVSRPTVRVRIVVRTSHGRTYRSTRTFHPCRRR